MPDQPEAEDEDARRAREFVDYMRGRVPNLVAPQEIQRDFTRYLMRAAFEDVWARPGLSLQQRSIATIAALTALGRPRELRGHIRIGLRNGLTRAEICEVLMHMAVYAGFPAALEGMRAAVEVFGEQGA